MYFLLKASVIELPESMKNKKQGVKRARKEAKGSKATETKKGAKKAKTTRKTKPKRDISGFQVC